jgi:hypothetical protein
MYFRQREMSAPIHHLAHFNTAKRLDHPRDARLAFWVHREWVQQSQNRLGMVLYRKVFDPQTRDRANGRPRGLINDGYGSHEALEVMQFCHENNIILVQFPSHSTHKVQPCDIGVFAPLKTYYGEEVDELCRGGVIAIGKQHFTEMYSKARDKAFHCRNIKAAWAKAGLYPWNPDRVLRTIPKPPAQDSRNPEDDPRP